MPPLSLSRNEGGKIRAFNMLRHLHEGHSVVVASLSYSQRELQAEGVAGYCQEVIAEIVPQSLRWARAARTPVPTAHHQWARQGIDHLSRVNVMLSEAATERSDIRGAVEASLPAPRSRQE